MYFADVKIEGKHVCHLGDPLWLNIKSIMG